MENLAGKFIVEKNGPDRKIRGLVFASLVHLDFDGTDIKLEPLEFFVGQDGNTFCTFYLEDKIFLDEDQLTREEKDEFFKNRELITNTIENSREETLRWIESNMISLNIQLLKRYPKYPGYEKAVREYREYLDCPEKLVLGYYTPRNQVQGIQQKINIMLTRAARIIHGVINRKDHDNRER